MCSVREIKSCWLIQWEYPNEIIAILNPNIDIETIKSAIEFYYATSECNPLEIFSNSVLNKSNYSGVHVTNDNFMSCGGGRHHITAQKIENVIINETLGNEYCIKYKRIDGEIIKSTIKNKD